MCISNIFSADADIAGLGPTENDWSTRRCCHVTRNLDNCKKKGKGSGTWHIGIEGRETWPLESLLYPHSGHLLL